MRTTNPLIVLVVGALFLVAACDEQKGSPAAPTSVAPASPTAPTGGGAESPTWKDLGGYTVTVTAAASCSLPGDAAKRTYGARLSESGQDLVVRFDDQKSFVGWAGDSGFAGTRNGDRVSFTINGDYFVSGYSFVFLLEPNTELVYEGTATGTMGDSTIVATFTGTLLLRRWYNHAELQKCEAPDHLIELVRK